MVDFVPNFDETEKEPEVLPVRIPNILINGADGIAVGMATSIPPHNLGEVIDGVIAYMKNNQITTKELMKYIQGPDFPTYETGTGKIKIRGKVETEKGKNGKTLLVISEIPYPMIGANIGKFLNDVAALVETKKTTDIVDISNQSSKEGIRIVLELKKGADAENLTNMLYKKTRLEDTFGVNMLAVADQRPETLGLRQIIEHHVDFQFEVATRKYTSLLKKERENQEIQEGLIQACDVIDLIIEILRGSKNREQVKNCLVNGETDGIKFKTKTSMRRAAKLHFTERQAGAILDMRLYKLIGLEIETLMAEHKETMKKIASYEDILNNYDSMAAVIMKDLEKIKKEYGRPRRTAVENAAEIVYEEKKIEETQVVFLMDRFGYARTVDTSVYERNKETADTENKYLFSCMNTDKVCVFTDAGRMHLVKILDLPYGKFRDKGTPIDNVSNYDSKTEQIVMVAPLTQIKEEMLCFVTRKGMVKLVQGGEFEVSKRTIAATKLGEDDKVVMVQPADAMEYLVLQTKEGYFLKFLKEEIPGLKKNALGVRGIRMGEKDLVEHAYMLENRTEYMITYREKQVILNKLKLAKRDTKGTKIRI